VGTALVLLLTYGEGLAGTAILPLVPRPREFHERAGVACLTGTWAVSTTNPVDEDAARVAVAEGEERYGWSRPPKGSGSSEGTITIRPLRARGDESKTFLDQGYCLTVAPHRIVIEGVTAQGRFYGVQTLRQLMRAHPDGDLPCCQMRDYPVLAWRGISDDISRGQVSTLDDFKAIIRQLAYYKINLYQLYIEDMFRFDRGAPGVNRSGALTSTEVAALVAEGRRNHVVVCPIFETLAHQERLAAADKQAATGMDTEDSSTPRPPQNLWRGVVNAAEGLVGRFSVNRGDAESEVSTEFSATDPRSLRLAQSRVDEIADAAPGPFFHLGGDEWVPAATRTGADSPSQNGAVRAYGHYLQLLASHLKTHSATRAMVYGDVILEHPDAARDLSRDVIIVDWHYDPQDSFPSLRLLKALGFHDVMASPALWTWRTFYPNYARGFSNVAAFTQAVKDEGGMGSITASWSDGGAENLRENNWAGYACAAAAAWERTAPTSSEFLPRFVSTQYGAESPELAEAERLLGWQEFVGVGWASRLYNRVPAVRPRTKAWIDRMRTLEQDMHQVERDLAIAGKQVRYDEDHLATMRHCAHRYLYIAERELCLDAVGRRLGSGTSADLAPQQREGIVTDLARLEATASGLREEFTGLWLSHNKREGLAASEVQMAKQAVMLRRLIDLARSGRLSVDNTFAGLQALSAVP
jgi:hexosaminidase